MTELQKRIFFLRRSGRSYRSIARELGVNETYVRNAYWLVSTYFRPTAEAQLLLSSFKYDTILTNLRFSCLAIRSLQVKNASPDE